MQFGFDENAIDNKINSTDIDEKNLVPATDEEIHEAIERALDELDEEIEALFSDEALEKAERADAEFLDEFEKANTVEERTAVLNKYHKSY